MYLSLKVLFIISNWKKAYFHHYNRYGIDWQTLAVTWDRYYVTIPRGRGEYRIHLTFWFTERSLLELPIFLVIRVAYIFCHSSQFIKFECFGTMLSSLNINSWGTKSWFEVHQISGDRNFWQVIFHKTHWHKWILLPFITHQLWHAKDCDFIYTAAQVTEHRVNNFCWVFKSYRSIHTHKKALFGHLGDVTKTLHLYSSHLHIFL